MPVDLGRRRLLDLDPHLARRAEPRPTHGRHGRVPAHRLPPHGRLAAHSERQGTARSSMRELPSTDRDERVDDEAGRRDGVEDAVRPIDEEKGHLIAAMER